MKRSDVMQESGPRVGAVPDDLPWPTFLAYDNLTSEQRHFISKAIAEKAKKQ